MVVSVAIRKHVYDFCERDTHLMLYVRGLSYHGCRPSGAGHGLPDIGGALPVIGLSASYINPAMLVKISFASGYIASHAASGSTCCMGTTAHNTMVTALVAHTLRLPECRTFMHPHWL